MASKNGPFKFDTFIKDGMWKTFNGAQPLPVTFTVVDLDDGSWRPTVITGRYEDSPYQSPVPPLAEISGDA